MHSFSGNTGFMNILPPTINLELTMNHKDHKKAEEGLEKQHRDNVDWCSYFGRWTLCTPTFA